LHVQIISGWLSRWELATPQIREYYNWSLECNYASIGTELYNNPNVFSFYAILSKGNKCYVNDHVYTLRGCG